MRPAKIKDGRARDRFLRSWELRVVRLGVGPELREWLLLTIWETAYVTFATRPTVE